MSEPISDERLCAYLDGELDTPDMLAIEQAVAASPDLQNRVRLLAEAGGLLRAAYNAPLQESAPPALQATIEKAFAERDANLMPNAARRGRWRLRWPLIGGVAGAAAAMAVVMVAGVLVLDARVEQRFAKLATERAAQRVALEMAMQQALEAQTSGQVVAWQAPDRGLNGTVTPVRTFRNTEGRWCREYLQRIETGSQHDARQGIACRDSDGIWRTRLETYLES